MRGEMSVIGPRPERPEFVDQLSAIFPYYRARHAVKPGMTGWAQVNFRFGTSVDDARIKLEYDLYYVKHASLILDLQVMGRTLAILLQMKGGDQANQNSNSRKLPVATNLHRAANNMFNPIHPSRPVLVNQHLASQASTKHAAVEHVQASEVVASRHQSASIPSTRQCILQEPVMAAPSRLVSVTSFSLAC